MTDREKVEQQVRDMLPDLTDEMVQQILQRAQDVADWVPMSLEDAVETLRRLMVEGEILEEQL